MRTLLVLALLFASALAGRYDGYQVYEVKAKDVASLKAMVELFKSSNYDFWKEPRGLNDAMDVMVPPEFNQVFVDVLDAFGMEYSVKFSNVQTLLEESFKHVGHPKPQHRGNRLSQDGTPRYALNWENYYDLPVIFEFLDEIATKYPNFVTKVSGGRSYEGNDMPIIKISNPRTPNPNKKVIFIDGGFHAREWLSPAFVTWLIHELVENYANHPQYVDNIDWHIMPVVNPDGYRYTFTSSNNRLWRKNRRPNPGSPCIGTDLNRNFGFHWNEGGSSPLPCAETYEGPSAFSEIESQNLRDAVLSEASRTAIYLTFHTYGQYLLYGWGWTAELPEDAAELDSLAKSAAAALQAVFGTRYTVGPVTATLSLGSGGSDDWAKGGAGIKYSYTAEMRDTGRYGFELPPDQIIPNNLEMWEAVKVFADFFSV